MNKVLNNLSTFILSSCHHATNHEIINNELVITTKVNNIYNLLEDLKKKENLNFEMLYALEEIPLNKSL